MATPEQIREKFREMAKSHGPSVSNIARVQSVDEAKGICVLVDEDDQEYHNVRLRPVITNNKSMLLLPKIDTYVLAIRIEDQDEWMLVAADEFSKVAYYVNNTSIEIDSTGFLFQKENETFNKILVDLVAAIQAMSFALATPDTINGTTTNLINTAQFDSLKTRINEFLK